MKSSSDQTHIILSITTEELLDRVETLEYVTARYSGTFDQVARTCRRLVHKERVCVLLDFDVIDSYISGAAEDAPVLLAIDFFLEKGSVDFALPPGAFIELIEHLTPSHKIHSRLKDIVESPHLDSTLSTESAIRLLAEAIQIRRSASMPIEKLEGLMVDALKEQQGVMMRLMRVLQHPRFRGVRTGYAQSQYKGWLKVLHAQGPREHALQTNTKVLERDAMNLATACRDFLCMASRKERDLSDVGYILVTGTASLLNLIEYARFQHDIQKAAKDSFQTNLYAARDEYPVLHPYDLVTFELVGGGFSPDSLTRTQIRSTECKEVFELLQKEIERCKNIEREERNTAKARLQQEALEPFLAHRRQQLFRLLKDVALDLKQAALQVNFQELEQFRGSYDSLQLMASNSTETETELKRTALVFGRLFTELSDRLAGDKALKYHGVYSPPNKTRPFGRIEIRQKHVNGVSFLTGEFYSSQTKEPKHFVLRWPTVCTDVDLILGLKVALKPINQFMDLDNAPRHLEALERDEHPLRRNGIVVETSVGKFGLGFSRVSQWEDISIQQILRRLQSLGPIGGATPGPVNISRIRICGRFGEIAMDVLPEDGKRERMLTVSSRYNITELISPLFQRTAQVYAVPTRFNDVLRKLLARSYADYEAS